MASATSRLLALLLLSVPLLVSCLTCAPGEVYEAPLPQPEKCWECPEIDDAFEHGKRNIDGVGKSYDDFFCTYTITVEKKTTYIPNKETDRINQWITKEDKTISCYYGKDGRINDWDNSDGRCRVKAIAVPNCTPVQFANYTGEYERCCRAGCELEAPGRCFHCPMGIGGNFVDVDIKPGYPIECTYHGLGGPLYQAVYTCYFDPETGKAVSGYKGEAPCDGNTAKAHRRDYCRDRLPTCPKDCKSPDQCWQCPKIPGKIATRMPREKLTEDVVLCNYADEKEPTVRSKKFACVWDNQTGKPYIINGQVLSKEQCPDAPVCLLDPLF